MKRIMNLTFVAALAFSLMLLFVTPSTDAFAQQNGKKADKGFVDADGDGINDNAKDDDGDGIPNGQDPDFVPVEDGSGQKMNKGNKGNGQSQKGSTNRSGSKGFVDADGDGINDNAKDDDGDGIPNGRDEDYVRPQDGTGRNSNHGSRGNSGSGDTGSGDCDDSGPKGKNNRGGKN